MKLAAEMAIDAPPARVWPHVERLDRYPSWMRLVHRVEAVDGDDDPPVWDVELRARVGPFTRSKQLRMVRTMYEPTRLVRFERIAHDGRDHAEWTLSTTLDGDESECTVRAELYYGGELWAGDGLLRRVLDDEIRHANAGLTALVNAGAPTP